MSITIRECIDANSDGVLSCHEINVFLKKEFGDQWPLLEQDTIYQSLYDKYGYSINGEYDFTFSKINAIKTIFLSDCFFEDHLCFEKIICAICELRVHPDEDQELEIAEINYGLNDIKTIMSFDEKSFCPETKAYIAGLASLEGLVLLPDSLSFCQDFLDKLHLESCLNFFEEKELERAKVDRDKALKIVKESIKKVMSTQSLHLLNEDHMIDNQVLKLRQILAFSPIKRGAFK